MQLFVNLPVNDLARTKDFFSSLGFSFNSQFTDDKAACMIIGPEAYVMLLQSAFFQGFTKKAVADATQTTEVLLAISMNSRQEVDQLCDQAITAGGKAYSDPMDHGFMYQRAFADPDGHQWEVLWMDPSHVQPA